MLIPSQASLRNTNDRECRKGIVDMGKRFFVSFFILLQICIFTGCNGNRKNQEVISYQVETEVASKAVPYGYDQLSNEKYAWWFKRNENHEQPEAQKEVDLSRYDAWYVDEKSEGKKVYLTFDCGYENGYTEKMLDVLKKHNAKAVFFITAHYAKDAKDLVKRMKEEGHYVGNHTATHPDLVALDTREIKLELKNCEEAVYKYTGYAMDPLFRPPKGEYSERVLQIVKDMGYTTLFWSLAYLDYDVTKQPGADYVIDHYEKYMHPGAIPLIHNVSKSNAEALDQVLTDLEREGYVYGDAMEIGK